MLGQIEGALCTADNDSYCIAMDAIQVIDEVLDRTEEMERCRKAEEI
jgi:hypothetical protein